MSPIKNLFLFSHDKKAFFFYGLKEKASYSIKNAQSSDGYIFKTSSKKIELKTKSKKKESIEKCTDFRAYKQGKKHFLLYNKKEKNETHTFLATSSNLSSWTIQGKLSGTKNPNIIVPNFKYDNDYAMYSGGKSIKIAYSKDMLDWKQEGLILMKPKVGKFDAETMIPANAFIRKEGIVLFYYAIDKSKKISIGLALFSKDNPEKLLWRSPHPIWKQKEKNKIKPLDLVQVDDKIFFYYENKEGNLVSVALPIVWYKQESLTSGEEFRPIISKHMKNPIMGPRAENRWENFGAFNPTAFQHDGKVYILYRALGDEGVSVVGLAISSDGIHIDERLNEPIFVPENAIACKENRVESPSGGGYGGCEDPKVALIDGRVYLTYVSFNGNPETNLAISSISLEDFLARKWNKWTAPVLITTLDIDHKNPKIIEQYLDDKPWLRNDKSPGIGHKNPSILPEKIRGKYIFFNRVWPNIIVDELEDLNFDGKKFLKGHHMIPARLDMWDSHKISMGGSPLRIKEGWLAFYNAVDLKDSGKYKIGSMILDYEHPERVLYRTNYPIIEPEKDYENNGFKNGIVFAGGSVIKDDQILLYYGGSDTFTCVATAPTQDFVDKLIAGHSPKLHNVKLLSK